MTVPARLAVFASGGGTNLQALLERFNLQEHALARVELVIANRKGIGALGRAEDAGVPTFVLDPAGVETEHVSAGIVEVLTTHRIDLIALAGYLKLVPAEVVERFRGRILNIHPALLPAFGGPGMYGRRVHEAVLASGAMVSGATVHFVDERYDEGKILAQWPVPVFANDTPEELAARVLRVEHLLYPMAIERLLRGSDSDSPHPELAFDLITAASPPTGSVRRLFR